MVTLVVATTTDPASINPALVLLAMPDWSSGPSLEEIRSFVNQEVRLLQHDRRIVEEDYLDKRWEDLTGEVVDEIIFLSKHVAASTRPALTVHPIATASASAETSDPLSDSFKQMEMRMNQMECQLQCNIDLLQQLDANSRAFWEYMAKRDNALIDNFRRVTKRQIYPFPEFPEQLRQSAQKQQDKKEASV